jgi:transposase
MTYSRFLELFPDNDACLEHLKERFFADGTECPKCGKATKFHRIKTRSAYSCQFCGHHVYPTAGTIFHKSTVSLQLWFFGVYLMSSTRCGISAKQLEREIGVTYKTAHRMFKQIRSLLADDDDGQLEGDVEVDESAYGGKPRAEETHRQVLAKKSRRPTIVAMVERKGRVRALHVPDRGGGRSTTWSANTSYRLPCSSPTSSRPTRQSGAITEATGGSNTKPTSTR